MRTSTMLANAKTEAEVLAAVAVAKASKWTDEQIARHLPSRRKAVAVLSRPRVSASVSKEAKSLAKEVLRRRAARAQA